MTRTKRMAEKEWSNAIQWFLLLARRKKPVKYLARIEHSFIGEKKLQN